MMSAANQNELLAQTVVNTIEQVVDAQLEVRACIGVKCEQIALHLFFPGHSYAYIYSNMAKKSCVEMRVVLESGAERPCWISTRVSRCHGGSNYRMYLHLLIWLVGCVLGGSPERPILKQVYILLQA